MFSPQKPLKVFLRKVLFKPNGVCPVCGKVLFRSDSYLCERCDAGLPRTAGPECRYCGRPIEDSNLGHCGDCGSLENPVFDGGMVWLHYHGDGKKIIRSLKFGYRPQLGIWMGERMAEVLLEYPWHPSINAVIPVPLHKNRLEERGYNQSDYLAQGIAHYLGLALMTGNLQRVVDTAHQIGKNRQERLVNLQGAFKVAEPSSLKGKRILLIDDVNTTGATLRECAKVLKKAGVQGVYVATSAGVK